MAFNPETDNSQSLKKENKNRFGIRGPVFASLMIIGVVGVWLASGYFRDMKGALDDENIGNLPTTKTKSSYIVPKVKTMLSVAQNKQPEIVIRGGKIEAERSVTVRSEIDGKVVVASTLKEGKKVSEGELLCGIAVNNRQAEYAEAESNMRLRSLQLSSARKLSNQGYSTKISLTQSQANYNAAKSKLENAKLALKNTRILAPFDGVLEKVFVDVGDFMNPNTPCAKVIDMWPLVISGHITEDEVIKISLDETGWAVLPDGTKLEGFIRYIAHSANSKTRTYRIEMESQTLSGESLPGVRDGVTVQIHIPLKQVLAHRIRPSILTLNSQGQIGVRIVVRVGNKNIVNFKKVKIVAGDAKNYWVDGLPPEVNLIIVGQEYVSDGAEVKVDSKSDDENKQMNKSAMEKSMDKQN